jgi:hypothetical protein
MQFLSNLSQLVVDEEQSKQDLSFMDQQLMLLQPCVHTPLLYSQQVSHATDVQRLVSHVLKEKHALAQQLFYREFKRLLSLVVQLFTHQERQEDYTHVQSLFLLRPRKSSFWILNTKGLFYWLHNLYEWNHVIIWSTIQRWIDSCTSLHPAFREATDKERKKYQAWFCWDESNQRLYSQTITVIPPSLFCIPHTLLEEWSKEVGVPTTLDFWKEHKPIRLKSWLRNPMNKRPWWEPVVLPDWPLPREIKKELYSSVSNIQEPYLPFVQLMAEKSQIPYWILENPKLRRTYLGSVHPLDKEKHKHLRDCIRQVQMQMQMQMQMQNSEEKHDKSTSVRARQEEFMNQLDILMKKRIRKRKATPTTPALLVPRRVSPRTSQKCTQK